MAAPCLIWCEMPRADSVTDLQAATPRPPWTTLDWSLRRDGRLVHAGPGAFEGRKAVPLLVCTCGQAGCWSLEADIHVDEEAVRWLNFSSTLSQRLRGANYKSIEPLVFERKAYFKALARLAPAIGSVLKKRNAALASARQARRMARGRTGD
jgi:hypothetical protein